MTIEERYDRLHKWKIKLFCKHGHIRHIKPRKDSRCLVCKRVYFYQRYHNDPEYRDRNLECGKNKRKQAKLKDPLYYSKRWKRYKESPYYRSLQCLEKSKARLLRYRQSEFGRMKKRERDIRYRARQRELWGMV